jgi:septum formation protein
MRLLLASASPRRAELLASLGLACSVLPGAALDEAEVLAGLNGGLPSRLERLAQLKGADAARANPGDIVLSADTVVVLDGAVMGKPRDDAMARLMLLRLSGQTHQVLTGVCVQRAADSFLRTGCETTSVSFRPLTSEQVTHYIALAQPYDFAGSYAIQGLGALLVQGISGDYSNVVGLPLGLTAHLLAEAGLPVL